VLSATHLEVEVSELPDLALVLEEEPPAGPGFPVERVLRDLG
jgi:hypothetical protein